MVRADKFRLGVAAGLAVLCHSLFLAIQAEPARIAIPLFTKRKPVHISLARFGPTPETLQIPAPLPVPVSGDDAKAAPLNAETIPAASFKVNPDPIAASKRRTVVEPAVVVEKTSRSEAVAAKQATAAPPFTGNPTGASESAPEITSVPSPQTAAVDTPAPPTLAIQKAVLRHALPLDRENRSPGYPALARKRKQQGVVLLEILVDRLGGVADLRVLESSGFPLLDRAAVSAVRLWRYQPARQGDEAVDEWIRQPVRFMLD